MAILAPCFFFLQMGAQQGKAGLRVVEFIHIQHHDFRTTPFVLGMADTAFVFAEPAMESLMIQDVRTHFLVAVHAQFGLRLFVEPDMTLLAIDFELGVACDHLSGHQRGLPRPQRNTGKGQGQSQENKA